MSRRNIFEILQGKVDLKEEIERIEVLAKSIIVEDGYNGRTLGEFIDKNCLPKWKSRMRCISYQDMREKLDITEWRMKQHPTHEQMLTYLEFIANMLNLCEKEISRNYMCKSTQRYTYLLDNVISLINDMNYDLLELKEEEQLMLVEKNSASTAVAEIIESDYALKVIEYNHFKMKGDIERKREALSLLANKFEAIRPELNSIDRTFASNIGQLLNKMNIRHNNTEGANMVPYVRDLSKEQLEDWYDEIYQMILLAILRVDNIERSLKVKELITEINNK